MKTGLFIMVLLSLGSARAQEQFSKAFPLQWKVKIGVTTYRTNMVFQDGNIYIGSNGLDRNFRTDSLDGVVRVNAKTGKITKRYCPPIAGDNDVTGIAIDGNKLFCGSDNYTFYCYDITSGQELWKYPVPYDVESAPVLADFTGDGKKDVSFCVERNGFYALNGVDGTLIWKNDSISCHNGNTAALPYDVNNDGVMDLLTAADGYNHCALDGKTGDVLWVKGAESGINSSPFLVTKNQSPVVSFGQTLVAFVDTYGLFQLMTPQGDVILKNNSGYSQFMMPVINSKNVLYLGNYAVNLSPKYWMSETLEGKPEEDEDTYMYLMDDTPAFTAMDEEREETISASVVLADVLGNGTSQALVATENGTVIMRNDQGQNIKLYKLPKGAEATMLIQDIDDDGKLEILVADLDGYLSCYATNSRGKVEVGGYR